MQKSGRHFSGGIEGRIVPLPKEESQFPAPTRPRKLLDHARDVLRVNHCSTRTEEAYTGWRVNAARTRQGFGLLMLMLR